MLIVSKLWFVENSIDSGMEILPEYQSNLLTSGNLHKRIENKMRLLRRKKFLDRRQFQSNDILI